MIATEFWRNRTVMEFLQNFSRAEPVHTDDRTQLIQAYLVHGAVQLLNRQPQQAIEDFRLALLLDPTCTDADGLRAVAFLAAGKYDEARGILAEYKDRKVGPRQTFSQAVVDDLRQLKEKGVVPANLGEIERRLAEDFPAASA